MPSKRYKPEEIVANLGNSTRWGRRARARRKRSRRERSDVRLRKAVPDLTLTTDPDRGRQLKLSRPREAARPHRAYQSAIACLRGPCPCDARAAPLDAA